MRESHDASCHCGTVRLRVTLADGLHTAGRCTCSFCAMRGAVTVMARVGDVTVTAGEEALSLYRFGSGVAQHWFCARCGIYTHHRRRSNPDEFAVNLACLDGLSPFDLPLVVVSDGQAHVSDTGVSRIAGVLTYKRMEIPT